MSARRLVFAGLVSSLAYFVFQLDAFSEFDLSIRLENGTPVIAWSNATGEAFQLLSTTGTDGYSATTETPYMGTGAVFRWSSSKNSGSMPIVMGVNYGYRFRIISISNNPAAGSAWVQWACQSGRIYRILRTSSLVNWNVPPIASNLSAVLPYRTYMDSSAGLGPQFYAIEEATSNGWLRSDNAAGFYTISVTNVPELILLRNDFAPLNGSSYSFNDLLGNQSPLTLGSKAMRMEVDLSIPVFSNTHYYVTSTLTASGWSPDDEYLHRGDGFWLLRTNGGSGFISLKGELPASSYSATSTIAIINSGTNRLHLIGYPFPVDIHLTNTTLWINSNRGDQFFKWNRTNQIYEIWQKGVGTNFSHAMLRRGDGFFYRSVSTAVYDRIWYEPKPYSWP